VEATLDIAKVLKKLIDFNSNRWKLLISYNFFILLNFSIFIFILNEKEVKKFGSRYFKMRNLWERDYRHVARSCTKIAKGSQVCPALAAGNTKRGR
jgi:hypothetical protein